MNRFLNQPQKHQFEIIATRQSNDMISLEIVN